MGLEKQFQVCFLVKRFDFNTNSRHSDLPTKPQATKFGRAKSHTSRCSLPKKRDEKRDENSNTSEELVSCQVYKLPSLLRNYTPKEKKKQQNVTPQVFIQGQKCFEEDENGFTETLQTFKSLSTNTSQSCTVSSVDDISFGNSAEASEEANTFIGDFDVEEKFTDVYTSTEQNLPCLEGKRVSLEKKLSDERTLRRIERLKTLKLSEKTNMKEFYFPDTQDVNYEKLLFKEETSIEEFKKVRRALNCSGNECEVGNFENYQFSSAFSVQESHKNHLKAAERKVIELPKVESYDILTPRKIITSDVCHVFRESAIAKVTVCDSKRGPALQTHRNKRWQWRKKSTPNRIFEQTNIVEMRNPSPIRGLKLNPKKEVESIDEVLKLVEESNQLPENNKLDLVGKKLDLYVPVKKFVIHLPPIC